MGKKILTIMKNKHQKHTKLTRPDLGFFHKNEWAIIGTPCSEIQELARLVITDLAKDYRCGYVDADHAHEDEADPDYPPIIQAGGTQNYTDKIHFHRFDRQAKLDTYQYRSIFNDEDVVIVNGNHFIAKRQIVVVDPRKEKSLCKKLDRLTKVDLILLTKGVTTIPDYLKAALAEKDLNQIPVYAVDNISAITLFIKKELIAAVAPLSGLVLAGGKSRRMGRDKGKINYHGMPQREYVHSMLDDLCDTALLSCRPEQNSDPDLFGMPMIFDSFSGLGPFGAILSAFRKNPNTAWLVVACDLPLLDEATLKFLISHRNPSTLATAFHSPDNEFPEPLITIWEPRSYSVLLSFLAQGYSCPRKVLINSEVELLTAPDTRALTNVNAPSDLENIQLPE